LGIAHLGDDAVVFRNRPDQVRLVNGVGSIDSTVLRRKVYEKFREKQFLFEAVLHPSAIIAPEVHTAEGMQIMAGVVVQPGRRLEENVIVNTGARVDHDCLIYAHAHIAPGVTLSGYVHIGKGPTSEPGPESSKASRSVPPPLSGRVRSWSGTCRQE
jgi:tetrahydrodipicolinate N-succinyltransferase